MTGEKPCCAAAATRMIKKLTMPNGSQVGIVNLESILKEVADLKLADNEAIKKDLLRRVKIYNYVAPSAEADYSKALLNEYEKLFGKRV
ncbi:MAG: hypothetical protein MUO61_07205 [Dehalococcoidia bacterium]|nr:hypothetical protein [Dehalococcoidia bacterium]